LPNAELAKTPPPPPPPAAAAAAAIPASLAISYSFAVSISRADGPSDHFCNSGTTLCFYNVYDLFATIVDLETLA